MVTWVHTKLHPIYGEKKSYQTNTWKIANIVEDKSSVEFRSVEWMSHE